MTDEDVVALLKSKQAEQAQGEYALSLGVSPAFLSNIYSGRRTVGSAILKKLKLRAVIRYEASN